VLLVSAVSVCFDFDMSAKVIRVEFGMPVDVPVSGHLPPWL